MRAQPLRATFSPHDFDQHPPREVDLDASRP
jgi:hypothetical protein